MSVNSILEQPRLITVDEYEQMIRAKAEIMGVSS
jgi:hypothetical protein